jgi:hypothetical protein
MLLISLHSGIITETNLAQSTEPEYQSVCKPSSGILINGTSKTHVTKQIRVDCFVISGYAWNDVSCTHPRLFTKRIGTNVPSIGTNRP